MFKIIKYLELFIACSFSQELLESLFLFLLFFFIRFFENIRFYEELSRVYFAYGLGPLKGHIIPFLYF